MAKRTKRLTSLGEADEEIRINKFLSEAGVCSRREADRFITEGKVKIDGIVAEMGSKVTKESEVTFFDKPVKREEKLVLIAFNKSEGIVSTTDRNEPDNIIDYLNYGMRIYPIGRLDKDSEGLILLTNDGNIVNKILRAENKHEKEYIVTVNKEINAEFIKSMSSGVPILDTVTNPCIVTQIDKYTFNIILTQGLNRQIRRMCEHLGYRVVNLKRIRIMNIQLGRLKTGDYRNVTEKEIEELNQSFQEKSMIQVKTMEAGDRVNISKLKPDSRKQDSRTSDYRKPDNRKPDSRKPDHGKSSSRNTDSAKTDYRRSDSSKPDNRNTDIKKPDYKRLDSSKSYSRNTDSTKPDYRRSESSKPDSRKSDSRNTDSTKLDFRRSDSRKPDSRNSYNTKPDNRRSDSSKQDSRNTDSTKPDYRRSDSSKPDSRKPDYRKPDSYKTDNDNTKPESRRTNDRQTGYTSSDRRKTDLKNQENRRSDSRKPGTRKADNMRNGFEAMKGRSKRPIKTGR